MKIKKLFMALPVLFLVMGFSTAYAANLKVGVVDLPYILQHSTQVKAINKKLKSQFSGKQEQIIKTQNKVREQAMKLSPSADKKLSASERKQIQGKVQAEQKQLQKMVLDYQKKVSSAQQSAMKQFMGEMNSTVKNIAKKQGIDIVLLKPAVIYADNTVDVTNKVLDKLPKN